jgi:hypothetical protein
LVEAAKLLEAGTPPAESDLSWRSKAAFTRDVCWERVVEPALYHLTPAERAAALRAIAQGIGSKI